ncbi:acetoacetate decarboxylase family protein [Thermocoleostomius sinensis]|uniref:Acetoacetate decarboxylase family protein n=1 Tax=Thermocoleostomius sinensis A174 TaxID=2016057 RepID=A0A9E8ZBK9_9CYAN|nr:acetoacetate decarboxylase family protein [Thermocoleostomius sinensis]WAL58260.1 acetoacetate decarboxylase family protein [Thermocoleostomius sinensis A174]
MRYPSPPWRLTGFGFQTIHLLDIERVSSLVPSRLDIVPVLPGKTLGIVYAAAYTEGSTLIYSELIVVNAIVHYAGGVGAWISHIYVDHPESVAGGREIWGLPKELAQFDWNLGNSPSVCVRQNAEVVCTLQCQWHTPGLMLPLGGSVFSSFNSTLMTFRAQGQLTLHLAGMELQVPPDSPFAWLIQGRPILGVYLDPLQIDVEAPIAVVA